MIKNVTVHKRNTSLCKIHITQHITKTTPHTQSQMHKTKVFRLPKSAGFHFPGFPENLKLKTTPHAVAHWASPPCHTHVLFPHERRAAKPEWASKHSPRKYHFLPLSEQLKTLLVCAFSVSAARPSWRQQPGRERKRERERESGSPGGRSCLWASESLFTTSCACYFHQNRAQSFSSPLVFLCFWQEAVIVKHQVPLCFTEARK